MRIELWFRAVAHAAAVKKGQFDFTGCQFIGKYAPEIFAALMLALSSYALRKSTVRESDWRI